MHGETILALRLITPLLKWDTFLCLDSGLDLHQKNKNIKSISNPNIISEKLLKNPGLQFVIDDEGT